MLTPLFNTIEAPIPSHYHQYQCPRPSRSWPHLPGKPSLCKRRSFQKSPENFIMMNKSHAGDNRKLIASNVFYLLLIDMSYSPWRKFGNLLSSLIADVKVFQLHIKTIIILYCWSWWNTLALFSLLVIATPGEWIHQGGGLRSYWPLPCKEGELNCFLN